MKFFKIFIIFLLLSTTVYINNKSFISSRIQPFLLADFNENMFRYNMEFFKDLDIDFPNLSGTALPIKVLVGRYYKNIDSIEQAKKLFKDAIRDNPYIKSPEAQLAYLYYDNQDYDSAYYYAKDAFYSIPDNNVHRDVYFKVLTKRKDTIELQKSFELLMNLSEESRGNESHWLGYADAKYQISGPKNKDVLNTLDKFQEKFPNYDQDLLNGIRTLYKSKVSDISIGESFSKRGDQYFKEKNYLYAAEEYEFALAFAAEEYAYYENAAISYYLADNIDKAIKYFDKVIYDFKPGDGKSEFYKGILLIELDSLKPGCDLLKKSVEMEFSGSGSLDVYNNFCN